MGNLRVINSGLSFVNDLDSATSSNDLFDAQPLSLALRQRL